LQRENVRRKGLVADPPLEKRVASDVAEGRRARPNDAGGTIEKSKSRSTIAENLCIWSRLDPVRNRNQEEACPIDDQAEPRRMRYAQAMRTLLSR